MRFLKLIVTAFIATLVFLNHIHLQAANPVDYMPLTFGSYWTSQNAAVPADTYTDLEEYNNATYPNAEIIGTLSNGIGYWDPVASKWTQMTAYITDGDIAAGDFTGDGKADVASCWNIDGLWYQDGITLDWTKIDNSSPYHVTAGDITGDGRDEIIGTWDSGIWYWDFVASKWTQMTAYVTDGDIAAGDFNGDGKADVASCWDNDGLWYQNGANLDDWTKIDDSPPFRVTAGDVTGK